MTPVAGAGWTTADYALVISLFSAVLAVASFGWNVWSKFIYPKAKLRVRVSFVLFDEQRRQLHYFPPGKTFVERLDNNSLILPAMRIYATNYGPGEIKLGNPVAARAGKNAPRREGYAQFNQFIKYPFQSPLSLEETRLETPLKPADDLELYIETTYEELLELNLVRIRHSPSGLPLDFKLA